MQGIVLSYRGKEPKIGESVFVSPTASVIGDVEIGTGSSIWFGVTVRGDFQPVLRRKLEITSRLGITRLFTAAELAIIA